MWTPNPFPERDTLVHWSMPTVMQSGAVMGACEKFNISIHDRKAVYEALEKTLHSTGFNHD